MSNDVISDLIPGQLSAPELLLSIFDSAREPELSAAYLVRAGELFGIDSRALRVALGRLVKRGILQQISRGRYGIGKAGEQLHQTVRAWRNVEDELVPWRGGWLAVYAGALGRADKTAVRGRERALRIRGFAAVDRGLFWVRPDNLAVGLNETRQQLLGLGLDSDCLTLHIDDFEPGDAIRPAELWDIRALELHYSRRLAQLAGSRERVGLLSPQDAAREVLTVGRAVTRDILMDPLLPEEMIDTGLRRRMIGEMIDYDRLAKGCWARLVA
jgi:phenylacetic acid degradation operon negative regulatory protein